jgi:hypothetical protein
MYLHVHLYVLQIRYLCTCLDWLVFCGLETKSIQYVFVLWILFRKMAFQIVWGIDRLKEIEEDQL